MPKHLRQIAINKYVHIYVLDVCTSVCILPTGHILVYWPWPKRTQAAKQRQLQPTPGLFMPLANLGSSTKNNSNNNKQHTNIEAAKNETIVAKKSSEFPFLAKHTIKKRRTHTHGTTNRFTDSQNTQPNETEQDERVARSAMKCTLLWISVTSLFVFGLLLCLHLLPFCNGSCGNNED